MAFFALKKMSRPVTHQDGSVLFFTLMILVIMAAAGLTMISNTVLESKIVRNASSRTLNFYAAEAAAMEAAQRLENETNVTRLNTHNAVWLNPNGPSDPPLADFNQAWTLSGSGQNAVFNAATNTAYTTVRVGVAKSASLGLENPDLLWEYSVLGRYYDSNNTPIAMIEVGFKKRY